MKNFYGSYSTTNLRKRIEFPENLIISNNTIKKRKSFNKDIYNININNFNINTRKNLIKSSSSKTIELVTGFKKVLEQTETIKQRIFNDNSFYFFSTADKSGFINYKNKRKTKLNKINSFKYYPRSIKNSYNNIFFDENKKFQTPTINHNISYKINLNTNFIEQENNDLRKESEFLINENNFLSSKIKEYKNKLKNKKIINFYGENSNVSINSNKVSLNYNVNNNLEIAKIIINTLKKIKDLKKDIYIKIKQEKNRILLKKQFEENNRRFQKLTKEKDALNFEIKKLKVCFEKLKMKEKIYSFKYESELKSKKNKIDLIIKLGRSIEKMNKSKEDILKNKFFHVKNLKLFSNSNQKYSNKINKLKLIHKYLENKKNILIKENKILRKRNNNKKKIINKSNKIDELKEILNELKKKNNENKLKLEKKDKQIIELKNIIKLSVKNTKDNISKLNISKLIKEDNDDKEQNNFLIKNNLIDKNNDFQKLNNLKEINNIKSSKYLIEQKYQEILSLNQKINDKNGILKIIEDKVKPLYKKSNTNTISKTSSFFNSINNNSHMKKEKNDYKGNIDWKSKEDNSFDIIRKRKSRILYMKNIDNNFKKNLFININK